MGIDLSIIGAVGLGLFLLIFMILKLRWPAFISLLIATIVVGLFSGLESAAIIDTVQKGMGSTLGFVATVVGLGALFGGILELSGGATAIAKKLVSSFGKERTSLSLGLTGFLIAIPVFFDVAFIILAPVIYAIQRKTKKSLLLYAIPLLAGLAITHAFIPPTPGPIAVAQILGADLGWVMMVGMVAGFPAMVIKIHIEAPLEVDPIENHRALPNFGIVFGIIALPICLIVMSTLIRSDFIPVGNGSLKDGLVLIGHPFAALILANLFAWYLLGKRNGYSSNELLEISTKSFQPVGIIILLTGAGGAFKQMLVETKAGEMLATALTDAGMSLIVFAFIAAALVRIMQGSATVAMITAAGLVAPLLVTDSNSQIGLAALVISIASGASIFSHVNDSGFWLVKEYLGLTEAQTFKTWSIMTTILAVVGFISALSVYYVLA